MEIKSSHAIDAVARKLCIIDTEARSRICLEAAFFLSESHAPIETLKLAQTILNKVDFPFEISARLLVTLCTYDLENAARYAVEMRHKLEQQVAVLRRHPEQYERFRSDFSDAILRSSNDSKTVANLLREPVYAQLLVGKLKIQLDKIENKINAGSAKITSAVSLTPWRQWNVKPDKICASARNQLWPGKRGLHAYDTLKHIDQAISGQW